VKLLRTIRLDASDSFVFEKPAEPGEWAVSGAFAFARGDPASLQGKARTAFRAGFLGLQSLGRSTLAQIVEAHEKDRHALVELLAAQLVKCFGVTLRPPAGSVDCGNPDKRERDHPRGVPHLASTPRSRAHACFRIPGCRR
jgi:hypothetical protein